MVGLKTRTLPSIMPTFKPELWNAWGN